MENRTTTDQAAARALVNACRRLDRAIASGDETRSETARAKAVEAMGDLAEEFGLPELAIVLRASARREFGVKEAA